MRKKYNTPHRRHVVKTRMTDEEYADFTGRLAAYEISQSEFIRQANTATTTNTEESLNPPNREHSHRTSQILAMQFGNARMHQAPPSMTRKPNAEARCLFR